MKIITAGKRFLPFYFAFIAFHAQSSSSVECALEKQALIESLFQINVDEYISFALVPEDHHDVVKAIATKNIGEWLELRFSSNSLQQIRFVTPLKTLTYTWDENCNQQEKLIVRSRQQSFHDLSDADLKQLLETTKNGVLYTISPTHPLSELALPSIIANAAKYNLSLTLLTDPTITSEELAQLRIKYPNIKKMESLELIYRGMFNHFPSTLLYKEGKFVGRPLLGARASDEIDQAFSHLLNEAYPKTPLIELGKISESPIFGTFYGQDTRFQAGRKFHLPRNMNVKFMRSLPNSDLILIFTALGDKAVHLYDTKSEKIMRTWENMASPYVSADGKFLS